ncbi:MAG TPA: hypothetical protein VLZ06_07590, partial [Solirubrobacteraceae bacterium]|nr:hypothetical protein [Solirubrobacteraceae bacterium]
MALQLVPAHRSHWYANDVGDSLQPPWVTASEPPTTAAPLMAGRVVLTGGPSGAGRALTTAVRA